MTEDKDPLLLDHEVDGIRELDNKLPRWWVWLFYLSILFGVIYLSVYHVFAKGDYATKGQMQAEYQAEMKVGEALKVAAMTVRVGHTCAQAFERSAGSGARQEDLPHALRPVPPRGRRRAGRPQSDRQLLDPRLQLHGQRHYHLERRAGQGHDHLEEHPQAQ